MKRHTSIPLFLLAGLFFYSQPATAQTENFSQVKKKLKVLAFQTVKTRCQKCKVNIVFKWISPKVSGASAGRIIGLYFDEPGMPSGYVNASVDLKGTDPTAKSAVQMYITIQKKVPVVSTRIERGTVVESEDLVWRWKDITRLNRQPVSSFEFFANKEAAHTIRVGDMVFRTDMVGLHSFRPGDRVVMLYKENGVRIEIDCVVRHVKSEGEKISLYSKETGQRYIAQIDNQNEIMWVKTL